jgi:hypothetical protein
MANSSLILSSLDFDTLKENFKTFLSTQSVFKDYNFEGSNINVLLDVMSYNSYLNSFYLNMVASEMFLDSAQKYESVISHAKELNYLPRSARSAESDISFSLSTSGISGQVVIPPETKFSGTNSNGTFTFTTEQKTSYVSSNSTFAVANLVVYEGTYYQDSFITDYNIENQRFLLSNKNIDIRSLTINVIENNGSTNTQFTRVENLYGLNDASEVFFLQGAENNLYEVVFGDGYFGRKPLNASTVVAKYRVSSGTDALGVDNFALISDLGTYNGGIVSSSDITVNVSSSGGANQEGIESIRFAAPRYFASQQRAVASDDYSSLILSEFGGEIDDVNVYGGELLEPKQYGRVVVALKQVGGTVVPDFLKTEISNYLLNYIAIPNRIILTDPDFFYTKVVSTVQYDVNNTTALNRTIVNTVRTSISNFASNNIGKFGSDLRYSKLVSNIDNADPSITSNDTHISIIKRLAPKPYTATSFSIEFNNSAEYEETYAGSSLPLVPILSSSSFVYIDDMGNQYDVCFIQDDGKPDSNNIGKLLIVTTNLNGEKVVVNSNLGFVNYSTGLVSIKNLNVVSYSNYISLYYQPKNKDIIVSKDKILLLDLNDVTVTAIETLK